MNEKLGMQGKVTVEVIKANGKKDRQIISNAVDSEIKNSIASGLQGATTYGLNSSTFSTDNFATPDTGGSGVVVYDGSSYYETATTSVGASSGLGHGVKIQSSTRASGSNYNLTQAHLGRSKTNGANSDFDIKYASTSFTQSVNDGQQIDITWEVTVS